MKPSPGQSDSWIKASLGDSAPKMPALCCTLIPLRAELQRQGHRLAGQITVIQEVGGECWLCAGDGEGWSPFQSLTVQSLFESPPRSSPEKEHPPNPAKCSQQIPLQHLSTADGSHQQMGVTSSWKLGSALSRLVLTVGLLDPGKMASGSLADSLLSQADWIPTDFHHQMRSSLCLCCLVLGIPAWVSDRMLLEEGILLPR